MASGMTDGFFRDALAKWGHDHGWRHHTGAIGHEHGPDIVFRGARKANRTHWFYIEFKRTEKGDPFIPALGQIVTRMRNIGNSAYNYGIALPEPVARKVIENNKTSMRLRRGVARRLRLSIFAVKPDGAVEQFTWKDL